MASFICLAASAASAGTIYPRLPPEYLQKIKLNGKEYNLPKTVGRGATSIVYKIGGKYAGREAVVKVFPTSRGVSGNEVAQEAANLRRAPDNLYLHHEFVADNNPPFWAIVMKDARELSDGTKRNPFLDLYPKKSDVQRHLPKFQGLVKKALERLARRGMLRLFHDITFGQFMTDKNLKDVVIE